MPGPTGPCVKHREENMPTLNYDETISDIINNDENWEDEVYGLLDPDDDEVLTW